MTQTVKSLVQNLYKFIAVNDKERETETERGKERWRDREGRREKKRKEGGEEKTLLAMQTNLYCVSNS